MDNLKAVINYLHNVKTRNSLDVEGYKQAKSTLTTQKTLAQEAKDETLANRIWCLEKVLAVQNRYAQAFYEIKNDKYYQGWCSLERVEIAIIFLERHFDISTDEFYIASILRHTEQFQLVYPYTIFSSPGFIHKKMSCTICEQQISIRNPCGHIRGNIYNGEMCIHRIDEVDLLEISMVKNPVQKYSVPFTKDVNGNTTDQYNYSHVAYFAAGLRNPFDGWELEHTYLRESHDFYRDIGRNNKCPCGSGTKYKKCCLKEIGVRKKHIHIIHEVPPPRNIPQLLTSKESFPYRGQKIPFGASHENTQRSKKSHTL